MLAFSWCFLRDRTWARDQWVRYWWRSDFFRGFWSIFQAFFSSKSDSLLQFILASSERILMTFLKVWTVTEKSSDEVAKVIADRQYREGAGCIGLFGHDAIHFISFLY